MLRLFFVTWLVFFIQRAIALVGYAVWHHGERQGACLATRSLVNPTFVQREVSRNRSKMRFVMDWTFLCNLFVVLFAICLAASARWVLGDICHHVLC